MTTTARFDLQRRKQLEKIFTSPKLTELWRKVVKEQMRSMEVRDLHDYYDFNYSVEARTRAICDVISSGFYRASPPLVYRSEKKLGVTRHMLVPSPQDTLVLQALTEALYTEVKSAQPSAHAYYARARHSLKLPHEIRAAVGYPWQLLWPKFQQEILEFSKAYPFLVTTDIANYFDNIGLRELRHVVSAVVKSDEVYLDLLFSLLEDLSWRPDYLPTSHKGLPTIEIEAPRLLAHCLLFEIDYLLKERTADSFVRWMDDINFGVENGEKARLLLGEINDVLKSRGLALNLGKTEVLTSRQAEEHFLFRKNLRLTKLDQRAIRLKSPGARRRLAVSIELELAEHLERSRARNSEKVTKRFFTVLGKLRVPVALRMIPSIFADDATMRSAILRYLTKLPFSKRAARAYLAALDHTQLFDDLTLYVWSDAVVSWTVPRNKDGKAFVGAVLERVSNASNAFSWLCQITCLAKYGEPAEVKDALERADKLQIREPFLQRQYVAVLLRLWASDGAFVRERLRSTTAAGAPDAASVAANLLFLHNKGFPPRNDRFSLYLFPTKEQRPYPIAKFLLLCAIGDRELRRGSSSGVAEIRRHVADPFYRHWLHQINPVW